MVQKSGLTKLRSFQVQAQNLLFFSEVGVQSQLMICEDNLKSHHYPKVEIQLCFTSWGERKH